MCSSRVELMTVMSWLFLVLLANDVVTATAAVFPPILFVTQPPFGSDFVTVNAVFGNHDPGTDLTPRGGDLYIRYSDGVLRNLTREAGFGLTAGREIAVREPSVHWGGTKALFSMGAIQSAGLVAQATLCFDRRHALQYR